MCARLNCVVVKFLVSIDGILFEVSWVVWVR